MNIEEIRFAAVHEVILGNHSFDWFAGVLAAAYTGNGEPLGLAEPEVQVLPPDVVVIFSPCKDCPNAVGVYHPTGAPFNPEIERGSHGAGATTLRELWQAEVIATQTADAVTSAEGTRPKIWQINDDGTVVERKDL